jgi:hypothetical protein
LPTGEVSQLVFRARQRGLLSQVRQGQIGGALTPKATALLQQRPTPPPKRRRSR